MMFQNKTIIITKQQVELFCECTNDTNRIHMNLQNSIVPGMLITSMIFEKPTDYWRLAKIQTKFISPIHVDESINYRYEVVSERKNFKKYLVKIFRNLDLCVEAEVIVIRKE